MSGTKTVTLKRFALATIILVCFVIIIKFNMNQSFIKFVAIPIDSYKNVCNEEDFQHKCLTTVISRIKLCILEDFTNSSNQFIPAVNKCSTTFFNNLPPFHHLKNRDETKYVLLPVNKSSECSAVSWGIGDDIEAEKALKRLNNRCRFFGADPIYQSGKVYKQIGDYYQTAVGAKDGNRVGSVLENGSYHASIVKYMGVEEFFKLTKLNFLDYLFMDNEGAEYEIIPLMEKSKLTTTICQFNAELHLPLQDYSINNVEFALIFRSFIANSDYIPVLVHIPHIRTVWINIVDRNCINKYFPNYCDKITRIVGN